MTIKVAGYGRVSTQAQALKATSLEEQQKAVQNECKAKGYSLQKFYDDKGRSGAPRPAPTSGSGVADRRKEA